MTDRHRDDLDSEVEFHLQERTDQLISEGMAPDDARREAERRFGNRRRHTNNSRRVQATHGEGQTISGSVQSWRHEVRLAWRSLLRSPSYAVTAVLTLALVSGGNLTMFGIADGLTFRPHAFLRDGSSIHRLYWEWTANGRTTTSASTQYPRVTDMATRTDAFSDVAAFAERTVRVGVGDAAQQQPIAAVSASYFDLFTARPARGRFFTTQEDTVPDGVQVAVLGYGYWQSHFGGREVLGQVLPIGDMNATIIGIAPKGFDGLNDGRPPAAFVPITAFAASTGTADAKTYFSAYRWGWVHVLVRRAPGVSLTQATAEATRVFTDTWPQFVADNSNMPAAGAARPRVILSSLRPGAGPTAGPEARTAWWLWLVAASVLVIGCANVANLATIRALSRRHEVGIKRALGVSQSRLTAGAFVEATLIAMAAGLLSLALAQGLRIALDSTLRTLRIADVSLLTDARTLIVMSIIVVVGALVVGGIPALLLRRPSFATLGPARGTTADGRRVRGLLLATQTMLSVALLVGAGLFVRSLVAVYVAPQGYEPQHVLLVNRVLPAGGFEAAMNTALRRDLLAAAKAHPDVESAAWMSSAPFVSTSSTDVHVPGVDNATALGPFTFQATTEDYFTTMGTRILRGRPLQAADILGAPEVIVVGESMARVLWPGQDPLGKCLRMRDLTSPCRTVVGVAEDIVQREIADQARLHYYVPIDQYPRTFGNGLLVKVRQSADGSGERLRTALQQHMPAGGHLVVQRLADVVSTQRASWQLGAIVLVGFGSVALIVAGIGLFGSVSYDIAQRSRECAIRLALGASRMTLIRTVVGRTVALTTLGTAAGLVIAAAFGGSVQPLLYRTAARDPLAFGVATVLMFVTAVWASVRPAVVAVRISPSDALKAE